MPFLIRMPFLAIALLLVCGQAAGAGNREPNEPLAASALESRNLGQCYRELATQREKNLKRLHDYAMAGRFPRNTDFPGVRMPYFVDRLGTCCAVADLMSAAGREMDVERIARADNHVRVMSVHGGALVEWVLESGLLQEECASIQPTYSFEMKRAHQILDTERRRIQDHLLKVEQKLRESTQSSLQVALTRLVQSKIDAGYLTVADIPALIEALNDGEPNVVLGAVLAIRHLQQSNRSLPYNLVASIPSFKAKLSDTDPRVRLWCAATLHEFDWQFVPRFALILPVYREALQGDDTDARLLVLSRLGNLGVAGPRLWHEALLLLRAARGDAAADARFLAGYALRNTSGWSDPSTASLFPDKEVANTPLHIAARVGDLEAVKRLLDDGGDPAARNLLRLTPLDMAAAEGFADTVRLLLDHPKHQDDLNTALQSAAWYGKLDVAKLLLERGAAADGKDPRWPTNALHLAAAIGDAKIAKLLIEHGASLSAMDAYHETPLHLAAKAGHADVVRLLLASGADVQACTRVGNLTALHLAAASGCAETVAILLEHKADPFALDHKQMNQTPFHFAARAGDCRILEILMKAGGRIEKPDKLLRLAVDSQRVEAVRFLLDHGADFESPQRLLQTVEFTGNVDIVKLLLERKADLNTVIKSNGWPLKRAVLGGHIEVARILLDAGADPNAPAGYMQSPLRDAIDKQRSDIVKLLLERGAK